MRHKLSFESQGNALSALLEAPDSPPLAYALFAHCFTCGKDIAAASHISRALAEQGIAVLRFDFTGLGNSDGDFANTNFSSNVQDLLAACDYLRQEYSAPKMLIGHSLGGAAVLAAADKVEEVSAVVTVGAPHGAAHVSHNFSASLEDIREKGESKVLLAGREFLIKQQFLDDIEQYASVDFSLRKKALLVMHSPLDETVSIDEAEKIYKAAKHPKSFLSLDKADHLLTRKEDSEYVATVIAGWAGRYLELDAQEARAKVEKGRVLVEEKDHRFAQNVLSDTHVWLADEPKSFGGGDTGPDPYEHLLAALGACTSMTLRMYANQKNLPLDHIQVELVHSRVHQKDCEECENGGRLEKIERIISLEGDLSEKQRARLLEIADRCPVHKTLEGDIKVESLLANA